MSDDGTVHLTKISYTMPVSAEIVGMRFDADPLINRALREMLGLPDDRSPEEIAAAAEQHAKYLSEALAAKSKTIADHAALVAASDGLRRAVLELHRPVFHDGDLYAHCDGCDIDGYDAEAPEFPCRTYELASGLAD